MQSESSDFEPVSASAPANIALIKYMGKADVATNRPSNASLSYTLLDLRTFVRISPTKAHGDEWRPLTGKDLLPLQIAPAGVEKFLRHFSFLKQQLHLQGHYLIESANNFPSDCGLASSASSFAALTLAAHELSCQKGANALDFSVLASLSRHGSGSSIRSFHLPWVLWQAEGVRPLEFPFGKLGHLVIVIDRNKKSVASSEAHQRVMTSLLYAERSARAEQRLAKLMQVLRQGSWSEAFDICWAEFWDLHAMFETSQPSFGYMLPDSLQVLRELREHWQTKSDGPIVTMDAGPNVHLLFRPDQQQMLIEMKQKYAQKWMVF